MGAPLAMASKPKPVAPVGQRKRTGLRYVSVRCGRLVNADGFYRDEIEGFSLVASQRVAARFVIHDEMDRVFCAGGQDLGGQDPSPFGSFRPE
jgi:hypothetical protein